jgi:hypothetical protein
MIALDEQTDFLCLVHERREDATEPHEDCQEHWFKRPIPISLSSIISSSTIG